MKNWSSIKAYQDHMDNDIDGISEIQQEGRQAKVNTGIKISNKMEELGMENINPNHRNGGIQKTAIIQKNCRTNTIGQLFPGVNGQLNSFEITMKQTENFHKVDLNTTQKAEDEAFNTFQIQKLAGIQNHSFNTTKGQKAYQISKQTHSGSTSQTEGTLLSHASINKLLESTSELQNFIGANKLNEMQDNLDMKRVSNPQNNSTHIQNLLNQEKEVKKVCVDYDKKINKIEKHIQEKGIELKNHYEKKKSFNKIMDSQLAQNRAKLVNLQNDFQNTFEVLEAQRDISKQALMAKNRQFQQQEYQNLELSNEISYLKGEINKEQKILGKQKLMEKLPLEQEIQRMNQLRTKFINDLKNTEIKKKRNLDQIYMLREDETQSNEIKVRLAYQIEEHQYQQEHSNNNEFYQINRLVKNEKQLDLNTIKNGIYEQLIQMKQRNILHVLIRELQQYIMSVFSGKTDCSMINSENLDKLSFMLDHQQISMEHAVKMLCEIARTKVDCNLNQNQILAKLQLEYQNFDAYVVDQMIQNAIAIEIKIRTLSQNIKQITKRINVEIKPQIYALEETSVQLLEQNYKRIQSQINQLDNQLKQKNQEIKNLGCNQTQRRSDFGNQIEFTERMNQISEYEQQIVERNDTLIQTKKEIQALQKNIKDYSEQIKVLQGNLDSQNQGLIQQIQDIESQKPSYHPNTPVEDDFQNKLQMFIQRLHSEKEQAINVQKYAIKKYEGIVERIQNSGNQNSLKRTHQYGSTQSSRMNNIQTQSQNLIQGKIISPDSDKQGGDSIKQNISIEDQSETHFSELYTDIGENTNKFNDLRNQSNGQIIYTEQLQNEQIDYSSEKNPVLNHELNHDIKHIQNDKYSQLHQKQIEIALTESIQQQTSSNSFYVVPKDQQRKSSFQINEMVCEVPREPCLKALLKNVQIPNMQNQKLKNQTKNKSRELPQIQMDAIGAQSLTNNNSYLSSGVQTQSMSMRQIQIAPKDTNDDTLHLSMLNVDISDPSFCLLDKGSIDLAKKSTMKSAQNSTINLLQLAATHGIDEIHLSNGDDNSKNEHKSTPIQGQTYSGGDENDNGINRKLHGGNLGFEANLSSQGRIERRQNSGDNIIIQQLLRSTSSQRMQARAHTSMNSRDSQSLKRHQNFFNLNHHSIAEVNVSNYVKSNQINGFSQKQSAIHSRSFNNIIQSQSNGSLNLKKLSQATNVQKLMLIQGQPSMIRKSLEKLPTSSQNLKKGYSTQSTKFIKKQMKQRSSSAINMYRDNSQNSIPNGIFKQKAITKHIKSSNAITRENQNGDNSMMNRSQHALYTRNTNEKTVQKIRSRSRETAQKQIINVNQITANFDPQKTWQEQLRSSQTNHQITKSKSPMTRKNSSQMNSQNRLNTKNAQSKIQTKVIKNQQNTLKDTETNYNNFSTTSMNHISPSPYINNHNKYYAASQATKSIPNSQFTSIEPKDINSNPNQIRKYEANNKRELPLLKSLDQWNLNSLERLQTTQEIDKNKQKMVKSLTQSNQLNLKSIIQKQNQKRPLSNCDLKGNNIKVSKVLKLHKQSSIVQATNKMNNNSDSAIQSYHTSPVNPSQNLRSDDMSSQSSSACGKFQKIEFKRFDQEIDEMQTFYVQIPKIQDKIIQFFNMITPLIEGANFIEVNSNMKYKLSVLPCRLDILQIQQQGGNQRIMLDIKSVSSFEIPQQTMETIKVFKQQDKKVIMNFIFNLKLKQDSGSMQFSTSNYSNLKRWAIGINALIQNQRSLVKLGQMMNLQN